MSFPFGSRASFRDRTGMSGDEILDDMLKNIKQRKKEFFESPPKWRSMGMFDDELGSAGGSRVKAHLGNLAARHPELADHLVDLLPEEATTGSVPNKEKKEVKKNYPRKYSAKEGTTYPETATTGTQTGGLESDIKLRSTVPDMQSSTGESDAERGQRSQSAPPQATVPNRPQQQKDESARHIPIRTDSPSGMHHPGQQIPRQPNNFQKPPTPHFQSQQFYQPGPQAQHFPEESSGKGPTVRHIPIFVEGRDEPLLPKDAGQATRRGGCQGKTDQAAPEKKHPPEQQNHEQGGQQHHHQNHHTQQQQHHHNQQQPQQHHQQQPQQHHNQQQQSQPTQTPTPPPQPLRPDALAQVAEVVKEVGALLVKVNEWSGTGRTDKEYIYLDEMLTRNLLKLDNIETEGKDEVRTARKDAIRRIQAAISVLECKADAAKNNLQNNEEKSKSGDDKQEPLDEKSSESQPSEPTQNETTTNATQT